MYTFTPVLLLTVSALLCLASIWTARQGRHLEPFDYDLLVKTGFLTFPVMVLIVLFSPLSTLILSGFTIIAVICYSLLFMLFICKPPWLTSKRFRIVTIAGTLAYIGSIPLIPKILELIN